MIYFFLFLIKIRAKLGRLGPSNNFSNRYGLSMTLQKQTLSASQGYDIAQLTITTLKFMRTAKSFKQFFDLLTILRPQYNVEPPVLPRK